MERILIVSLILAGAVLVAESTSATARLSDAGLTLRHEQSGRSRTQRAPVMIAYKCVFILGTGQSGSTALMDALNQLPNYLIRGEQWAAFWNIYESYMNYNWTTSVPESQRQFNWSRLQQAPFQAVKALYDARAVKEKLPWFNEFDMNRVMKAARSYYVMLYGYYGRGFVSGFKDSRYVCGRSFQTARCAEFFLGFMSFVHRLCLDVKVILNSRTEATLEANSKLYNMEPNRNEAVFVRDLAATHALYDLYAEAHPDHAFRVYYEDIYDPKKNVTLAQRLLKFLREDPSTPIRFTRMPANRVGPRR